MGKHSKTSVVVSYDFDGNLVKVYDTAKLAAADLGLFDRSVDKAIRMNTTVGGYQWRRYDSENDIEKSIKPYTKVLPNYESVKVAKSDEQGNIIDIYPSIKKAGKENNVSPKQIRECLLGHQHKAGGYYWKKIEQ